MEKKEMLVADVAKLLRGVAEATAQLSKNWDNFENIAKDMLQAAYDAGKIKS